MAKPKQKSVLSFDVGRVRVGLAGCDPLGITVTCLPPYKRNKFKDDLEIIKHHCHQRNVEAIVVGIPLDDKGQYTKQAEKCRQYGEMIARSLSLPIALVNEHSTTWAASQITNLRNDRTGQIDSVSAALLLEQWIQEGPEPKPVIMPAYQPKQLP